MKKQTLEKELLLAWKRCAKSGLSPELRAPLAAGRRERAQEHDQRVLAAFDRSAAAALPSLSPRTAFLMTDCHGVILRLHTKRDSFCCLTEGDSLDERYSGANAVALSLRVLEPVETSAQQHYCAFLNGCSCCAAPIRLTPDAECVALLTEQKTLSGENIALHRLLVRCVQCELQASPRKAQQTNALRDKQRYVLLCMAKGLTEQAAAAGLHISRDAIHYHKKALFARLGVNSSTAAVVKALQSGLIGLEEIGPID